MKILCIGKNYADHAKEMNSKVPKSPLIFMKPESALNLNESLDYPSFTSNLHYELELVLKISKKGKSITLDEADSYFDSIGLGIDFTARDIQAKCKEKGHPWEKAKAFDNSASLSPMIDKSSISGSDIKFQLKLNGELVQDGSSSDMIFNFNYLIHYASNYFTLNPGDLIFTGTPAGVGPVKKGDALEGYLNRKLLLNVYIN